MVTFMRAGSTPRPKKSLAWITDLSLDRDREGHEGRTGEKIMFISKD